MDAAHHHSHINDEVQCVPQLEQHVTTCHFEGGKVVTGYSEGNVFVCCSSMVFGAVFV